MLFFLRSGVDCSKADAGCARMEQTAHYSITEHVVFPVLCGMQSSKWDPFIFWKMWAGTGDGGRVISLCCPALTTCQCIAVAAVLVGVSFCLSVSLA